ncbi:hypothetical protein AKJ09_08016 [Labilithrix luteola]|uniref:SPOR domain-containing protein n=1 Tax=Labilithrix luteola TaxID=1391654 RepID=A0A0K1Q6J2_9BACT|nr:SPOR domain-containing protein [Labilithrix luteola]AKV01353.1 hypothetical protein AKJ09_08016 [Labilithrix luteola]
MRLRLLVMVVLVSTFLGSTNEAKACWCGYSAHVGRAAVTEPMPNNDSCPVAWDPSVIREWATWIVRLDEVLPAGASLEAFGTPAVVKSASEQLDVDWQDLPGLFDGVAKLQSDSARVERARAMNAQVYTVQIFASATSAGAARIAERANEAEVEDDGFFFAGDVPATNPMAHVIEETVRGRRMHKVLIGAFLDRPAALRTSHTLARNLGIPTFVRAL